ncbi:RcpC/CpaB family pilus assembly protein [Paenibacillus sp. FSL R5-0527]|uniref:Flp pilus assembly protein CpaB n=1 Tax=Paenibacillus sp. FSL R5-0527 TaxID=2975321 RepID=UPI00097A1C5C|nr:hypothetical protein BK140_16945 [Paenibacillus macerans]
MKKYWNKYTRSGLIILVGVLLALAAFSINNNMISEQVHTKKIIVAKGDIAPYEEITKDKLEYRDVVVSAVPAGAIQEADEINFGDAFASQYGFLQGMAIRKEYITTTADSALGSAVGLKDGMLHIGIRTDLAMSAGGEVKPGVLVNVNAFIRDEATGQTKTIIDNELKGLRVVGCLNSEGTIPDPSAGNSLIPAVVVLEVTEEQGKKLTEYQEKGKVYLLPSGTQPPIK